MDDARFAGWRKVLVFVLSLAALLGGLLLGDAATYSSFAVGVIGLFAAFVGGNGVEHLMAARRAMAPQPPVPTTPPPESEAQP